MDTLDPLYLEKSLDMVQRAFADFAVHGDGTAERRLIEEIRGMDTYLPELELLMLDESQEVIGYVMFSRFHLGGKFEDELLILTPCAVRTDVQRQHISRDLIEFGFERAKQMGYKAVIVEGNPANYRSRGFVTAAEHGILPGKTVHLPHIDCLMAKELTPGAFETIRGTVEYDMYPCLLEE